jgi:integrase
MERRPPDIVSLTHSDDPNFDRKLDLITAGAKPFIKEHILTRITHENCQVIIDYILAFQTEVNPVDRYRIDTIYKLKQLAEFHNPTSFKDMSRQDIIEFLDHLRKPESVDPLHQWKGSYEIARVIFGRFFRWLYHPDIAPSKKRPKPAVVDNIPKLKRLEDSIYKPTDMWTEEDDLLFYKYCPSIRDKCFWAVLRDTGCRVHELLKLKIKDVVIEKLDTGYHSARIVVSGKTGTRNVTITNSYPYLKEWLTHGHPYGANPNAPLFCGIGRKTYGRRIDNAHTIHAIYANHYKKTVFPKVLEDPLVPEEDKRKLKELLQKPWNPHARRHTAATEISKEFKDAVLIDQYMGWSRTGNTRAKYQHYFSDDAHIAKLEADGFLPKGSSSKNKNKGLLRPKPCPNCMEPNKPESRFCTKCKFVLSFDAYNESIQNAEHLKQKGEEMKKELDEVRAWMEDTKKKMYYLLEINDKQNQNFNGLYDFATNELLPRKQNKK